MRITNVDTLSAFFDRLISERIKLYHFENEDQEVEEIQMAIIISQKTTK